MKKVERKHIIVVSIAFNGRMGSEPGKGYHWTVALSRIYRVHLIHGPEARFDDDDSNLSEIERYETGKGVASWNGVLGYWHYWMWCRDVIIKCKELMERFPIAGIHHATLGSFRCLPRYDHLEIPYSLGPLGGGETVPRFILSDSGMPFRERLLETFRPLINRICARSASPVLNQARRVIATTNETAQLLRFYGAQEVLVRFPDVYNSSFDDERTLSLRKSQAEELREKIRLVWSGRGFWWKGCQLAVEFLVLLRDNGINAELDVYSSGPAIEVLKCKRVEGLRFHEPVTRNELIAKYETMHLFVYPTMHDSSSSAIPEAYSTGLPSMTLGIGGAAIAADPEAGLNKKITGVREWMLLGVEMVRSWKKDPSLWLYASRKALERSRAFGTSTLEHLVSSDLSIF